MAASTAVSYISADCLPSVVSAGRQTAVRTNWIYAVLAHGTCAVPMLLPRRIGMPMEFWLTVLLVIELTAVLAWLATAITRQTKYAFLFAFNVMLPVAWLYLFRSGAPSWRDIAAMASMLVYLTNMNVVILFWTKDTAMSKLDRTLRAAEKNALPFVMSSSPGRPGIVPAGSSTGSEVGAYAPRVRLVCPQRLDRVDPECAPRRDVRCNERNRCDE